MKNEYKYPYPWWTRIWPLSRIYFAGWERGQEAGIERGRIQMGATPVTQEEADAFWLSRHPDTQGSQS